MIKEALERMFQYGKDAGIGTPVEIDGRWYTQNDLTLVEEERYKPRRLEVKSLDAIVKLVKAEIDQVVHPVFIEVESPTKVDVYTACGDRFERQFLYYASADVAGFRFEWKGYEEAMIAFRSQFKQDEGTAYVLELLSKITNENSVKQEDNGMSQTVEIRKGVSLNAVAHVKPIIALRPYRTFHEVEQPSSEFLLRLTDGGIVGLFEADGGMWKLDAKRNIAEYLEKEFADMADVVVMV